MREFVKKGLAKDYHVLPVGKYRLGFGTEIDRDDRIVAMIYRNGDVTKTLPLDDIEPIINPRRTVPLNEN